MVLVQAVGVSSYGQSSSSSIPLASHLQSLESEFDIIFSYETKAIENVQITVSESISSLEEHLYYLQQNTPFIVVLQTKNSVLLIPDGQSDLVCISVKDAMTKKAVRDARLVLDANTYLADHEGKFKIPYNDSALKLKIDAKDYLIKTFQLEFDAVQECQVLFLNPFYHTLDEIVLTSLLTTGITKVASGGLEIDYEDFGLLPGLVEPDVLQSLQALPGIVSRGERVSYLNVRGGTHDQNLFLWDGIKMYNTSHFFGMISAFNPYMTQQVTLVKNGTSSKYGDGVSSLIDMKTSNTIVDSLNASVGLNLINLDAIIEAPMSKNASVEFSSRQSINSVWESPTYNQYFDKVFQNTEVTEFETETSQQNDDFSFFDAALNYKHQLTDQDYVKANFFYAQDQFELNRFDLELTEVNTRTSNLEQENIAFGLFYDRKWNKSTSTQAQFYTSYYDLNAVNLNLLNQQRLEQKNRVNEYGVKLNVQHQLTSSLALEAGYQLNETGILNSQNINDPGFFEETRNSILSNSLYSEFKYRSANQLLNVNAGGRLNHYTKFNEVLFEPRLSLSYQIAKNLFIEVLAEEKSQVTSQTIDLQTDFLGVENRRWVMSIPDERPIIQSQQVSAGLNFITNSWVINVDAYHKVVDGITTQSQGFQNQFELVEDHGSYEISGFDVLVNKNFKSFSGWVSYSYSENNYRFDNLVPSTFSNNLDIRHVVSTGINYEKNALKLSAGLNWHSGATATEPADQQTSLPQNIDYQFPNSSRLEDYLRLDLSSTYTLKLTDRINGIIGVSVLNLLDNENIYNRFYTVDGNDDIQTINQNGLGFTPNVLLRVNF